MSDTPRTDGAEIRCVDEPVQPLGMVEVEFSRQLERELSAATERIRRLEEAGDKLHWAFMHPFDPARYDLPKLWIEAKTKP